MDPKESPESPMNTSSDSSNSSNHDDGNVLQMQQRQQQNQPRSLTNEIIVSSPNKDLEKCEGANRRHVKRGKANYPNPHLPCALQHLAAEGGQMGEPSPDGAVCDRPPINEKLPYSYSDPLIDHQAARAIGKLHSSFSDKDVSYLGKRMKRNRVVPTRRCTADDERPAKSVRPRSISTDTDRPPNLNSENLVSQLVSLDICKEGKPQRKHAGSQSGSSCSAAGESSLSGSIFSSGSGSGFASDYQEPSTSSGHPGSQPRAQAESTNNNSESSSSDELSESSGNQSRPSDTTDSDNLESRPNSGRCNVSPASSEELPTINESSSSSSGEEDQEAARGIRRSRESPDGNDDRKKRKC